MSNNKCTILVTGTNGQLGRELQRLSPVYSDYHFIFTSRQQLTIENFNTVAEFFIGNKIDYCINCAAYTAVDKAESEQEQAFLINATAVGNLAKICFEENTKLIHISTDYVFDGLAKLPIDEQHPVNPISVYGASKLKGEQLCLQNNPAAIIIRTAWLYSSFGHNFVKTMLRLMKEKTAINVVNDQIGCPTYAADLAKAIMQIIETPLQVLPAQVFHYCSRGNISWYDFAMAIKEMTASQCMVKPIPASQYPTAAKRPAYSVLDTALIEKTFSITAKDWKASLKECLTELGY